MADKTENTGWDRRRFLVRSVKAAASVAAVGAAGLWFHDAEGPGQAAILQPKADLLDYSIAGLDPKMAIVRGRNRHKTLQSAFDALGGIETFIKKGDRVLLKVNAAFATPPMLSATTHPDTVAEMTRLCYQAGADWVAVTDNPINNPGSCFALSGIETAARAAGAGCNCRMLSGLNRLA